LNGKAKSNNQVRVPILYYHRVAEGIPPKRGVSPSVFKAQVNYLRRSKYHGIGFEDLANHLQSGTPLPPRPVIITFDDGYRDAFTLAFPMLKEAGFTATIFMVSGFIGKESHWEESQENVSPLLTRENILTLSAAGFQFGGHTRTHKNLTAISPEEAQYEMEMGKRDLEELLQKPVHSFAYPYGNFNEPIVGLVKSLGFKAARTVHTDNTHRPEDLLQLRCVKINGQTPAWKFKYYLTRLYHWDILWQEWKKAQRQHGR
jgi:peptidoglycan/xylan/chitin deacetylase (PgdA/CDA1 family)